MHRVDFRVSGFSSEKLRGVLFTSDVKTLFRLFNEAIRLVVSDINKVTDWLRTQFPPVDMCIIFCFLGDGNSVVCLGLLHSVFIETLSLTS